MLHDDSEKSRGRRQRAVVDMDDTVTGHHIGCTDRGPGVNDICHACSDLFLFTYYCATVAPEAFKFDAI